MNSLSNSLRKLDSAIPFDLSNDHKADSVTEKLKSNIVF